MKKANGDGSIYYEASRKKYCAAITDKNGKRTRKRFDTQAEAKKWLKLTLAELEKDEFVPPSQYTVLQWTMDYLELYKKPNVRETTLRKNLNTAAILKPIGNIKLQDLTPLKVQRFYQTLSHYSASTKHSVHTLLKEVCKEGVKVGLLKKNVIELVPNPKGRTTEVEIFTDKEILDIQEILFKDKNWKAIFLLALKCGMRRGEILALQISDFYEDYVDVSKSIAFIHGRSIVNEPKTPSSRRRVPITEEVKFAIKDCIGRRTEGYIFISTKGNPLCSSTFDGYWLRKLKNVNPKRKHFHALRHTFATKMLAAGVPVANVSAVLGHSSPLMTYQVYAHALPELDKKMGKIIEKAMKIQDVAPIVAPT